MLERAYLVSFEVVGLENNQRLNTNSGGAELRTPFGSLWTSTLTIVLRGLRVSLNLRLSLRRERRQSL